MFFIIERSLTDVAGKADTSEEAVTVTGGAGVAYVVLGGGRLTPDKAETKDWLEVSSWPRMAETSLRTLSVLMEL